MFPLREQFTTAPVEILLWVPRLWVRNAIDASLIPRCFAGCPGLFSGFGPIVPTHPYESKDSEGSYRIEVEVNYSDVHSSCLPLSCSSVPSRAFSSFSRLASSLSSPISLTICSSGLGGVCRIYLNLGMASAASISEESIDR